MSIREVILSTGDLVPFLLGFIGTTQQQGTSDNSTINLGFASSSNALSPGPAPAPGRRLLQGGFDTSNYNGDFSCESLAFMTSL